MSENKSFSPPNKKTLARLIAVQSLYSEAIIEDNDYRSLLCAEKIANEYSGSFFIQDFDVKKSPKIDRNFMARLLNNEKENRQTNDEIITKYLGKGWSIDKLDIILKSIIRLAVTELRFLLDVPKKVVIDQYVSISRSFFGKDEIGFANGIIDNIAKELRKDG